MWGGRSNPDGSFTFRAGFVCMLFYHIDFLKNKCKPQSLPRQYHVAHKKIPYADPKTGSGAASDAAGSGLS